MGRMDRIGKTATSITKSECITVRYHATDVVHITPDNIILNTGGWRTVTTRARMNQTSNVYNLGFYVFQKDYKWYVDFKGFIIPFENRELVLTR